MPSLHDPTIHLMSTDLALGATRSALCPVCRGGQGAERSFNVTRVGVTSVAYMCHRASCGFRGHIGTALGQDTAGSSPAVPSPYTGAVLPLDMATAERLAEKYDITIPMAMAYIKHAGSGWYAMPVCGPQGMRRGWGLRWPWGADNQPHPKYKLFLDKPDTVSMAWYRPATGSVGPIWLVEDQLSAMRLEAYNVPAVALLGTDLSARKVAELRAQTAHVVLALDAGATDKAFKLAQQWGAAFKSCGVVILQQDIKNMASIDLSALIIAQERE